MTYLISVILLILLSCQCLSVFAFFAWNGTIRGFVRDATGAGLIRATVTLVNHKTGAASEATTSVMGAYSLTGLSPGSYGLIADAPGYRRMVRESVPVDPSRDTTLDLNVEPEAGRVVLRGLVWGGSPSLRGLDGDAAIEMAPDGMYRLTALSQLLTETELYHNLLKEPVPPARDRPIIERVPAMAESGTFVEIKGRNFDSTAQIIVNGRPTDAVTTGNSIVGRMEGLGLAAVQVVTARGGAGPPVRVSLVRVSLERIPPCAVGVGETAEIALAIQGTDAAVQLEFSMDSRAAAFVAGAIKIKTASTGGPHNILRIPIVGRHRGVYEVAYRVITER